MSRLWLWYCYLMCFFCLIFFWWESCKSRACISSASSCEFGSRHHWCRHWRWFSWDLKATREFNHFKLFLQAVLQLTLREKLLEMMWRSQYLKSKWCHGGFTIHLTWRSLRSEKSGGRVHDVDIGGVLAEAGASIYHKVSCDFIGLLCFEIIWRWTNMLLHLWIDLISRHKLLLEGDLVW